MTHSSNEYKHAPSAASYAGHRSLPSIARSFFLATERIATFAGVSVAGSIDPPRASVFMMSPSSASNSSCVIAPASSFCFALSNSSWKNVPSVRCASSEPRRVWRGMSARANVEAEVNVVTLAELRMSTCRGASTRSERFAEYARRAHIPSS